MSEKILISLIAALLNFVLSVLIPCSLGKSSDPWIVQFRKMFDQHRQMLITSSILVGVIVYLALLTANVVQKEMPEMFENLSNLGRRPVMMLGPSQEVFGPRM
jgi:hypothetical protein